jgi:acyl dehydratase
MIEIPQDVLDRIGVSQYEGTGGFPVEQGYIFTTCASVENGNPLFWEPEVAQELTGGPIAPPTMLSVWFRPHHWSPGRTEPEVPLQAHFDLKEELELPEAIISENTNTFYEPVRIGDMVTSRQVVRSISEPKTTKLGTGRVWGIDVEYVNQDRALLGVVSDTAVGYTRVAVS